MAIDVADEDRPRPVPASRMPVGTVLLHPQPTAETPGRAHQWGNPDACRIIRIATAHPDEWSWRRLTGIAVDVLAQWSDLTEWRRQSLAEVGQVLGA